MLRLVKPRLVARRLSTLEAPAWGREEFYAQTRLPVEQATTLAPELYTDDAVLAHEARTLFRRNWVCVGHASELARHGDVMPVDLPGNQPLFLANNKGTINAFHNVCRHRGARLVEKKGRHNMISCPYHRWGYALSGELKGTPCWDTSEVAGAGGDGIDPGKGRGDQIPPHVRARFDTGHVVNFDKKDYGLFGCGVAQWGNMLFVNPSAGAGDRAPAADYAGVELSEHIGELAPELANYPLHETVVAREKEVQPKANWKLLAENFLEYYHLPSVHPALCKVSGVEEHIRTQGRGKYMAFATNPLTNGGTAIDPDVAPPMPGLSPHDAESARHVLIYPNVFMSIYPHHIFRVILEPTSAGVTNERTHLLVHPSIFELDDADAIIDGFMAFHTHVNSEDMDICESVQRGIHASPYRGGRYSFRFEETLHRFHNMVADSLVGNDMHVPAGDAELEHFWGKAA